MLRYLKIALFSLLTMASYQSGADRFSYVYIQGDTEIPFYVKLDDYMLPRYSKNYCIIPQLAAGPIRLQILFQQNQYPPQTFNIQVPQDGHRGFLLTKAENGFALYDVQQRFYLLPGDEGEDHLPQVNAGEPVLPVSNNIKTEPADRPTIAEPKPIPKINRQSVKSSRKKPETEFAKTERTKDAPQFLDVELNHQSNNNKRPERDLEKEVVVKEVPPASPQEQNPVSAPEQQPVEPQQPEQQVNIADERSVEETGMHNTEEEMSQPVPALSENAPPIVNSDCPDQMSDPEFDDIFITSRSKNSDDKRIGYLMKKAAEKCFSTRQAFLLSRQLQAESMRYSFLKKVYPHVTDQQNFPMLADALFKTLEWKSYFKLIYE
ncbi:MAG TPA: DUF4476 domain-containing protein [Flavipsychrobacter sp.]|nr:DUF4476 domain-containing protein [Flavipsychrobacter sp.]